MKPYLKALLGVARRYPNWKFPPETAQAWASDLAELPIPAVQAACAALCRESEYPPTLAAIHKRASILSRPGGPGAKTAGEAWVEVKRNRELASAQRYESRPEKSKPYTWSSEAVRRAAESVDWRGDWEGESAGTIRAQFERHYAAFVAREAEETWRRASLERASGDHQLPPPDQPGGCQ